MKEKTFIITILICLNSCTHTPEKQEKETIDSIQMETVEMMDTNYELIIPPIDPTANYSIYKSELNDIPPNGKYRFDIAFAEWDGKSMGEKVTVIVNGDSIKIVYEGDGNLTLAEKGDIIDEGQIMRHKSGNWIIGTKSSEKELDEVGGCTSGPAIIDFKNNKYWMC